MAELLVTGLAFSALYGALSGKTIKNGPDVPRVVVVGSSGYDFFSYSDDFPVPGETLKGNKFRTDFGGKGANQAVMASRIGASVSMVSKIGADNFGQEIVDNFKKQGVDTKFVTATTEATTAIANILVNRHGENCIVVIPGAHKYLTKQDVHAASEAICCAKVLLTQLEIEPETTFEALKMAHEAGVLTILNPAPACNIPDTWYPYIDILCPNETELQTLTNRPVTNKQEALPAAKELIEKGVKNVLVTLGKNGSLLVTSDGKYSVPCKKVDVIDTTGAGDCFLGTLAYFLSIGDQLEDAIVKAGEVATMSVQKPGTQASYPSRSEIPQCLFKC